MLLAPDVLADHGGSGCCPSRSRFSRVVSLRSRAFDARELVAYRRVACGIRVRNVLALWNDSRLGDFHTRRARVLVIDPLDELVEQACVRDGLLTGDPFDGGGNRGVTSTW